MFHTAYPIYAAGRLLNKVVYKTPHYPMPSNMLDGAMKLYCAHKQKDMSIDGTVENATECARKIWYIDSTRYKAGSICIQVHRQ